MIRARTVAFRLRVNQNNVQTQMRHSLLSSSSTGSAASAFCSIKNSNSLLLHSRFSSKAIMSRSVINTTTMIPTGQQVRYKSTYVMENGENHTMMAKYLEELESCRTNGNWRQALRLLDEMDKADLHLDAEMYEMAIESCARSGKMEVLPGLLDNMQVDGIVPTTRSIDFTVQAFLQDQAWGPLTQLGLTLTSRGIPLSLGAFQACLEACGMEKNASSSIKILQHTLENLPDDQTLSPSHSTAVIRACGMANRADLALQVFHTMEQKANVVADPQVFNQLIRSQIVNGDLHAALHTFGMVKERQIELEESIYAATIDFLVTRGDFWLATRLFEQMTQVFELKPSIFCLGRMMLAQIKLNKQKKAYLIWQQIVQQEQEQHDGRVPIMRYVRMLRDVAPTGESKLMVSIFQHLKDQVGLEKIPSPTFSLVIRAYGRLGLTEEAMHLFHQLMDMSTRHPHYTNATNDQDFFVDKDPHHTATGDFIPLRPHQTVANYLAAFNALSRDQTRDPLVNSYDAKRIWDLMVENVDKVLPPAYASIAGVFASAGDFETLEMLLQHAREVSQIQVFYHDEQDQQQNVVHVDDNHTTTTTTTSSSNPTLPEEMVYNGIISGLAKSRLENAHHFVSLYLTQMQTQQIPIRDATIRAATDTFCVKNQVTTKMHLLLKEHISIQQLTNAEICFGDCISKLLQAKMYPIALEYMTFCYYNKLHPPIRNKMFLLNDMSTQWSVHTKQKLWKIPYGLALETLNFNNIVQENVDSVLNAMKICMEAEKNDLVLKLYQKIQHHLTITTSTGQKRVYNNKLTTSTSNIQIPLEMYKLVIKSALKNRSNLPLAQDVCTQMLTQFDRHQLDGECLSLAISIKSSMGDDEDVVALFENMLKHNLEPNSYAFHAAIAAYSRASLLEKIVSIRDHLVSSTVEMDPNVVHSLIYSFALAKDHERLMETQMLLGANQITKKQIITCYLYTGQLEKASELLDATCSNDVFVHCLTKACDVKNVLTGYQICVKWLNSMEQEQMFLSNGRHVKLFLQMCQLLIHHGEFTKVQHLLESVNTSVMKHFKLYQQKEMIEMMLFVYGENGQYEKVHALLTGSSMEQEKEPIGSFFPLTTKHFEIGMEFCHQQVSSSSFTQNKKEQAHVLCLQLFETLRQKLIKPNGAVYLMALKSALQLNKETTAEIILQDARDNRFNKSIKKELTRQINQLTELLTPLLTTPVVQVVQEQEPPKRKRGRPRKNPLPEENVQPQVDTELTAVQMTSLQGMEHAIEDYGRLLLFCRENGLGMDISSAKQILTFRGTPFLTDKTFNELATTLSFLGENSFEQQQEEEEEQDNKHLLGLAGTRWG